jgi:hypothetical protein
MTQQAWIKELEEIQKLKDLYILENQNLLKEIEALAGAQDEVVTLLYSRRSLEVLITELCEEKLCRERGTEPLNSLIDKLYKEKFLPEYIQTSMQNLNRISTFGAHPKEFDTRQVRTALIELVTVLEWYFKERNYKKKEEQKVGSTEEQRVGRSEVQKTISSDEQKVGSSEVRKIRSSEEGNREKTEDVKYTVEEQKPIKKLPLAAIAIALLSVVIVVTVILFVRHNTFQKQSSLESKMINIKTKEENKSSNNPAKQDTLVNPKTDEIIVNTNLASTVKPTTQQVKPDLKKETPVVKENKKTYTIPENVQQPKEENIYELFDQLSDSNIKFSKRKDDIVPKLLKKFDKQAYVTININNQPVETKSAADYINHILTLNGHIKVKIKNPILSPEGKIKTLDVAEIRK